ncbi:MAG TPA: hypothetical protein VN238_10430 [Solirubrobacteraceae bacterium]|nr:hypothetical protein [Solirubrobacteraceae bacterium]
MDGNERQARIARNEVVFRRVNEAIEPADGRQGKRHVFVCECGRLGCTEMIVLSRDEYDAVRTSFDRFVLVPGHEIPDAERVVERREGFIVVQKEGTAREVVRRAREDEVAG